ncbi:MAG: phasin family protein [Haliea sp.]|nr:phasin family protein [Haliea sp.]MBK6740670.1 phasin family protein [Haliea sp.]
MTQKNDSDTKDRDKKDKVSDKASEIAKNIWLAGVGAYGRAVEEAQDRLEKAMEPPKLFRDLVKAGTALEEGARESTVSARQSVEERINRVRENFHNQRPARMEDLAALHKKVDQLTRKVDKLSKALAAQGAGKLPAASRQSASKSSPARRSVGKPKAPTAKAARKRAAGKSATSRRKPVAS